jgi:hypothetical protein
VTSNLENKRQRFEEADRFPLRKVVIYVSVVAVVALLGAAGYSRLQASKQASSGVTLAPVSGAGAAPARLPEGTSS